MERRPISRLTWDPGELYWKVWVQDHIKYVPFFQNSVKIGRKICDSFRKDFVVNVLRRNEISPQHSSGSKNGCGRYK